MPRGNGVTFRQTGDGTYKLRWRERNARGWTSRSHTFVGTPLCRDRLILEIREALAANGTFEVALQASTPAANLLEGMQEMIRQRALDGRYGGKTPLTYRSYMLRVAEHLHVVAGIPVDEALPVTVLSREAFAAIKERDVRLGISRTVQYASTRLLLDAWEWMASDPARWRKVPAPPAGSLRKDFLPRTPRYGRTIAPSLAHIDACLRAFPERTARSTQVAGVVMRFTGLRASQVFAIHRSDLQLEEGLLHVREGKGTLENADHRFVPLAPALLAEPMFRDWVAAHPRGELFPSRPHASREGRGARRKLPTQTFRLAWEASGAPTHVWAPPGRVNARPEHAFRAAFQAFLRDGEVAGDVIDFLVGHHPHGEGSLRDRHYGRELESHARRAVALLPPIGWICEGVSAGG